MATNYPWMQAALSAAQKAFECGEVPIGAVLIYQNKPLVVTHNLVEHTQDATAHAELLAIQKACELLNSKYLPDCDLYVTLEPCLMCAGAIAHTKIRRVIFGAYDPKGGAIDHGPQFFNQPTCHHHPEIISGIEESKCQNLLKTFFQTKRYRIIAIALACFLNACTSPSSNTNFPSNKNSPPLETPNESYRRISTKGSHYKLEPLTSAEKRNQEKFTKENCPGRN